MQPPEYRLTSDDVSRAGSDSADAPMVSVGMPVYNAGRYLRAAVLSMMAQTFRHWELILIDDASTDGALASIADLQDPRIRILRGAKNLGLATRLNEAVGLARGKYFARMDQDDISHPERLERQLEFLESNLAIDVVGSRCLLIDGEGHAAGVLEFPSEHGDICRRPWRGILLPHPTWLGKTEWFRRHPYTSPGPYFCEDQDLLLRAHKESTFRSLPEPLLAYRVRGPIPTGKLLRTRATLAGVQVRHFLQKGDLLDGLKAVGAFAVKCGHDLIVPIFGQQARSSYGGVPLIGLTRAESEMWRQVLPQYEEQMTGGAPQDVAKPSPMHADAGETGARASVRAFFLQPHVFWILAFVFCCLQALMVQKLVLPLTPSLHGGHGLLINDAILFHEAASKVAERINSVGWSEWSLFPANFTGNVGILSALYAVFGPEPAVFIPLNVAAHVTGALMLYLIGPLLWPGRPGRIGGLVAAVLFVMFPSTLLWYSQNHKDSFAIAGALILLFAWLSLVSPQTGDSRHPWLLPFLLALAGLSLVLIMRPYLSVLLAAAFLFSGFICWLSALTTKRRKVPPAGNTWAAAAFLGVVSAGALIGSLLPASETALRQDFSQGRANILKRSGEAESILSWRWVPIFGQTDADNTWRWQSLAPFDGQMDSGSREPGPPVESKPFAAFMRALDAPFKRISELRVHFIAHGISVGAGSGIEEDQVPDNILDAALYLPRALVVGTFAPFPSSWAERVSLPRLAAAGETFVWYLFFIGAVALAWKRPSRTLLAGIAFCSVLLAIFSYTNPNVGTLYRVRFGYWMFILLCGSVGWMGVVLPLLHRVIHRPEYEAQAKARTISAELDPSSAALASLGVSGAVALLITFIGFLGFLGRDLLLINLRGMGGALDAFFAAAMLPMVFVTCLVMPMADAVTKPFLAGYHSQNPVQSSDIIARFLGVGVLVAVVGIAVTVFAAPQAIRALTASEGDEIVSQGTRYLRLFAPIIFLSVWTVLGNSVLNSLRKSAQAAGAQLIVPVCAVSAIMLAEPEHALLAGIYGMLVGTALNAAIVLLLCRRQGIRLLPSWVRAPFAGDSLRSYLWLASGAVFSALLVPLNYYFASTVGEGSVSAWAFASKIIILFNGLFAFGVTAVVLPHLARKFDRQQNAAGRNHLYLLLVAGTWGGGFIALALSIFAEPLVYALLSTGDKITEEQIVTLARVLRLGALQVPVAISGAIALKSAAISGVAIRAVLASFCGLALNLLLNRLLVPVYGLEGIALGALGALMVSTVLLCAGLRSGYGMSLLLGAVLIVGWLVWVGAAWAVEIHSAVAMMAAGGALVVLVFLQWLFWSQQLHHRRSLRHTDVLPQ